MRKVLTEKNILVGYLYFYIHFVVETLCFYSLSNAYPESMSIWLIPFIYDAFAFVPQSIIGYIKDKYLWLNTGLIGIFLLILGFILFNLSGVSVFISLLILCLGNAFLHIDGAEVTLRCSGGKLSHSAIFVGGGSFGVITGKLLASINISPYILILMALSTIPFIMLANNYKQDNTPLNFDYTKENINDYIIILCALFIVIVRGYMGYGIPVSWNKTMPLSVLLYVTMGLGKALGGILSDAYGIKKVAILSALLSVPFLIVGDNIMIISLIGVMLFSMSMSITLAILVSKLKSSPGLAFGITTIGLFLGTVPIFFIKISNTLNIVLIILLSGVCVYIFNKILKGEKYG